MTIVKITRQQPSRNKIRNAREHVSRICPPEEGIRHIVTQCREKW